MNELYHQMTLDEWVASKKRIREMIRTAKTAFIVIGYELRKIDEAEAYKMDGYTSLADFAKGEYGFEKTMTSRLVEVNKAFSEGGYSDILIEDAEGFSFSKLIEMKDLDKEDLQLLRPEVKREDIRELKKFEAEAPDGREGAEGIDELLVEFFRKRKEQLNEIFGRFRDGILSEETELAEIISPTGNVAFRKGMWMAFFYADGITLKDRAGGVTKWTYTELFCEMSRIFGDAAAAGEKTWEAYYGEPEEESAAETQQEEQKPEQSDQKPEQSGQKPEQSGQNRKKLTQNHRNRKRSRSGRKSRKAGRSRRMNQERAEEFVKNMLEKLQELDRILNLQQRKTAENVKEILEEKRKRESPRNRKERRNLSKLLRRRNSTKKHQLSRKEKPTETSKTRSQKDWISRSKTSRSTSGKAIMPQHLNARRGCART